MHKLFMMMSGVCLFTQAHAFPCYITMVKDNCWSKYSVSVDIVDADTQKVLVTMSMPAGKSWDRQEIVCQPMQTVQLKATYSPEFWKQNAGKVYDGKRQWSFPEVINKGDTAWNMNLCYASDFQEVPLPPNVTGECACDTKDIPVIQPR